MQPRFITLYFPPLLFTFYFSYNLHILILLSEMILAENKKPTKSEILFMQPEYEIAAHKMLMRNFRQDDRHRATSDVDTFNSGRSAGAEKTSDLKFSQQLFPKQDKTNKKFAAAQQENQIYWIGLEKEAISDGHRDTVFEKGMSKRRQAS